MRVLDEQHDGRRQVADLKLGWRATAGLIALGLVVAGIWALILKLIIDALGGL